MLLELDDLLDNAVFLSKMPQTCVLVELDLSLLVWSCDIFGQAGMKA